MDFFGIGILEILVILITALLVIGPERLPEFARKAGKVVRNFRRMTSSLTSEVKKAMELDEEVEEMQRTATEVRATLDTEAQKLQEALDSEAQELAGAIDAQAQEAEKAISEGAEGLAEVLDKQGKELAEITKSLDMETGGAQGAAEVTATSDEEKKPIEAVNTGDIGRSELGEG